MIGITPLSERTILLQDKLLKYWFINIENKILSSLSFENTILSTGGSSVYSDIGMNHIKYTLNCDIIHLHLSFIEFNKRVTNLNKRGVVNPNNLSLKGLYNERINCQVWQKHFFVRFW